MMYKHTPRAVQFKVGSIVAMEIVLRRSLSKGKDDRLEVERVSEPSLRGLLQRDACCEAW